MEDDIARVKENERDYKAIHAASAPTRKRKHSVM